MPRIVTPLRAALTFVVAASVSGCAGDPADGSTARELGSIRQRLNENIVFDDTMFVCDEDQRQLLRDETVAAYQLAEEALGALTDKDNNADRVQRWFGEVDVPTAYTILNILSNSASALESNTLIYQCQDFPSCGYAEEITPHHTDPDPTHSNPYEYPLIKFYPLFFADVPNKYSQSEVIFHEATHVAGTSDLGMSCAGYQMAYDLAQSDPASAAYCAGNYQYFAVDAQVGPDAAGCVFND